MWHEAWVDKGHEMSGWGGKEWRSLSLEVLRSIIRDIGPGQLGHMGEQKGEIDNRRQRYALKFSAGNQKMG